MPQPSAARHPSPGCTRTPGRSQSRRHVGLVVSKLVTPNVLPHGCGTCTLELTARRNSIKVAVHDHRPQAPLLRTCDLNGGTGFSWPVADFLARATARTCRTPGGKTVCGLLAR
jgi:hypothetical protein